MKRIGIVLVLAMAIGCGKGPETAGRGQRLRFAVIPKALDIPVFNCLARQHRDHLARPRDR